MLSEQVASFTSFQGSPTPDYSAYCLLSLSFWKRAGKLEGEAAVREVWPTICVRERSVLAECHAGHQAALPLGTEVSSVYVTFSSSLR